MTWLAVLVFPHSSVAVHVRVCTNGQTAPSTLSTNVRSTFRSHASVAVACSNTGSAWHSIVVASGKGAITGFTVSSTEMVWLAVRVFPQSSTAVHVRTYTAGQDPVGPLSENVSVTLASHASVAVGDANTGWAGHSIVLEIGRAEIVGATLSSTEIVWLAVRYCRSRPSPSTYARTPAGQDPVGPLSEKVSDTSASHASVAVGVAKLGDAGHSIVLGPEGPRSPAVCCHPR